MVKGIGHEPSAEPMEPLLESPSRIEPATLPEISTRIADAIAGVSAEAATLGKALHPRTAANLADLVRIMNTYYSNLIEGHNTRPRDIERALAGDFLGDEQRRDLQVEAANHVRVQAQIDRRALAGTLPEPASSDFLLGLHRDFYKDAPPTMLAIKGATRNIMMIPGEWRSQAEHEVTVGRHLPPSSARVADFMRYFERRYAFARMGKAERLVAMAAAHHRFNYIHPFPDGNGRVSRLMSHAMAHVAGIGAHGLWSISRGLARGLGSRADYKAMMDHADMPRQGDLDGRGNLSQRALEEFVHWFLQVCADQLVFMGGLFDIGNLVERIRLYVDRHDKLKPESKALLEAAFLRGEVERGEASALTQMPARSAQRVLAALEDDGLLASDTPKGPVSLRFPLHAVDMLFPRLFSPEGHYA
jgi:Fic family protein